jgi:invasion protein IalB
MKANRRSSPGALLAALLVVASQPGFAAPPEPLTPPNENLPLSEPEVAPRGRAAMREIKYSQWRKLCFKAPGKDALCRTSITGTWNTGQMAVRLDLIEREGHPRLQILLPVGLYLQAGVKLRFDRNEVRLPYSWCFSNLCVAGAPVGKAAITALGEARTVSVDVLNSNLVAIAATIPTDQFLSAYKGAPAEVFEQIIEE